MSTVTVSIEFMDGSREAVEGYRVVTDDGLLKVRTSHNTAYTETWRRYPLANIKKYTTGEA
ncbi:MAG TPA: hypothetical protein VKZ82_10645 [Nonomuraea sp.]|nr:hypothetical protein [Nonomuraea sp.]